MPIVQFTRFKTDKTEEMVQIVRQAATSGGTSSGPFFSFISSKSSLTSESLSFRLRCLRYPLRA